MTSLFNSKLSNNRSEKITSPNLNNFSHEPVYNTKAAVQLSGVPAPTLRAWERRYGVLSPERAGNAYRLYSERDVVKICWLREQVERGINIRQAVALLQRLENQSAEPGEKPALKLPVRTLLFEPEQEKTSAGILSFKYLRQTLLEAFLKLDENTAEKIMTEALAVYPVEEFCVGLLEPVLVEIGQKWMQGELSVVVEHFASAIIRAQLGSLLRAASRSEERSLVLAGCAPGEHHEIGLLMITLFMRRQGLRVIYLGQNVPVADFMDSITQLRPALVCISCSVLESLGGLVELTNRVKALAAEVRPKFSYGGYLFKVHPELSQKLPGYYLGANATEAVHKVRELARHNLTY